MASVNYKVSFQICNNFPFPSIFFFFFLCLTFCPRDGIGKNIEDVSFRPASPATKANYFLVCREYDRGSRSVEIREENISGSINTCDHFRIFFLPLIKNQVEIISGLKSVFFIEQLLLNSPISTHSSHRCHSWSDARLMCVK